MQLTHAEWTQLSGLLLACIRVRSRALTIMHYLSSERHQLFPEFSLVRQTPSYVRVSSLVLLSEQNNLLRTLINKTSVIEMNGSEVGAEVIQSERAIQ